jgi:hypothetical protein
MNFHFEDVRPIIEGNKVVSGRIRINCEAPKGQRYEFIALQAGSPAREEAQQAD